VSRIKPSTGAVSMEARYDCIGNAVCFSDHQLEIVQNDESCYNRSGVMQEEENKVKSYE
jgi:hypothetical protein